MATDEQWRLVEWDQLANSACVVELRDRVEALEANMNGIACALEQSAAKLQQDEDVEGVAGDLLIPTDEELAACSANAAKVAILEHRDYDKALTSADITKVQFRALYDLGRKHGATQATCSHIRSSDEGTSYCALAEQSANSKPTSADTGLLPMIVSETGSDDEPEIERIICSAISGGADYVNGMPRELSLERIRYGDDSQRISACYVQAPLEVAEPTLAPAGALKESLTKNFRLRRYAASDVIEVVASWLEHQQDIPTGVSADYFAALLRKEAGR
jgi:hypothetical protein